MGHQHPFPGLEGYDQHAILIAHTISINCTCYRLLCLLLVQLFPNHTRIHVIGFTIWTFSYQNTPTGPNMFDFRRASYPDHCLPRTQTTLYLIPRPLSTSYPGHCLPHTQATWRGVGGGTSGLGMSLY